MSDDDITFWPTDDCCAHCGYCGNRHACPCPQGCNDDGKGVGTS